MGNPVPSWQTYINCSGGHLIIRHLKKGLAENLDIPWPKELRSIKLEKVRLRAEDFSPISQCGKKLDSVELRNCELEPGTLSVLESVQALRCLQLIECEMRNSDFAWLQAPQKLELLDVSGNPNCTGEMLGQLVGAPLRMLYLNGTGLNNSDIQILLSFAELKHLEVSDTSVNGEALIQLAANPHINVVCNHDREGLSKFRAAQRQQWKKNSEVDEETSWEALQLVQDFWAASMNRKTKRCGFVTQKYLDYCKSHGYNGVDPEQQWFSRSESTTPPYQDCNIVDIEQITKKKYNVYIEKDDVVLSQYRFLVIWTKDGWKIDKSEKFFDGKWCFYMLQ